MIAKATTKDVSPFYAEFLGDHHWNKHTAFMDIVAHVTRLYTKQPHRKFHVFIGQVLPIKSTFNGG